jgi:hypothetical protein
MTGHRFGDFAHTHTDRRLRSVALTDAQNHRKPVKTTLPPVRMVMVCPCGRRR